jgi:hypothetical protein
MWEKKSNWDMAVRVPLLVKVPGKPKVRKQYFFVRFHINDHSAKTGSGQT